MDRTAHRAERSAARGRGFGGSAFARVELDGADRCDLHAAILAGFEGQGLSAQSSRTLLDVALRFVSFVERGWGPGALGEVDGSVISAFLTAPIAGKVDAPSVATSHLRRSAVRLLFRVLRQAGFVDGDPTLDVALPARSSLVSRPLSDDEVAVCRSYSLQTLTATRQPAAWALAEASARTSELPRVRVGDLDLEHGRVWLPGATKVVPRSGLLTEWGVTQLARRLDSLSEVGAETSVVYGGIRGCESGQASACAAISDTMRRAGLADEPDVRPVSVAAWAGRRAFEVNRRIEDAARVLGIQSLDRAARLIGWDWTTESDSESG
jgi:integrase/recombinase XerC